MALANILGDFILVRPLGIAGLYVSTIICRGVTYIIDIYVVYKEKLSKSVWNHYKMLIKWLVFLAICGLTSSFITGFLIENGIISFILKGFIVTLIYAIMFICAYGRTDEFSYYKKLICKIIRRRNRE